MSIGNQQVGNAKVISASGNVKVGAGALLGVFCNTTTAGTLTFYDDAAAGTSSPVLGPLTPAAGTYTPLPFAFSAGLNVVVGGAINATLNLAA